ncbi:MAG: class I SAM-dependent methyltransferase [Candidatus Omnitrophica bacterium]|nr:class I SAM-dependent methyltransferase [Candidatus Omnitrophota bacterium]
MEILSNPAIYLFVQNVLGAKAARYRCVKEYVDLAFLGRRILDVGCGPGYVIDCFPKSDYVGFDTNEKYIRYANRKYGNRGHFFCQEFNDVSVSNLEPFDLIMMNGLIHHLSDTQAVKLLQIAKSVLKPKGIIVTLDGCYVKGQSSIAKKLLDSDRGKYVRDEKSYHSLASQVFDSISTYIRHDFMRIPYTLIIMRIS